MRDYINKTVHLIPKAIDLGNKGFYVSDEDTARFYGNNHLTGWAGFKRKVKIRFKLWRQK